MDRKIKFRAYLKNYNEIYEVISIDFSNEEVLVTNKDNDEMIVCFEDIVLLQYTGLKDKNGKEIYEGDILGGDYYVDGVAGKVVYDNEIGVWSIFYLGGGCDFLCNVVNNSIVVGNMYKNTELLKEE